MDFTYVVLFVLDSSKISLKWQNKQTKQKQNEGPKPN